MWLQLLKAVHLTFSSSVKGRNVGQLPSLFEKRPIPFTGQASKDNFGTIQHLTLTHSHGKHQHQLHRHHRETGMCFLSRCLEHSLLFAQAGLRWKQDDNERQEPFFANGLMPNGYPRAPLFLYSYIEQPIVHQELQPITRRPQIPLYRPHIMRHHGRTR